MVASAASTATSRRATISNGGVATQGSHTIRTGHVAGKSQDLAAIQSPVIANAGAQPLTRNAALPLNVKHSAFTALPSSSPSMRSEISAPASMDARLTGCTASTNVAAAELGGVQQQSAPVSNAPALNTELRAMARRQREMSREKGREKLFVAPLHPQAQLTAAHLPSSTGGVALGAVPHYENMTISAASSATLAAPAAAEVGATTASAPFCPPSSMQHQLAHRTHTDGNHPPSLSSHQAKKNSPRVGIVKVNSNSMSNILNNHQSSRGHASHKGQQQGNNHHHRQQAVGGAQKISSAQSVMEMPTRSARQQAVQPYKAMSDVERPNAQDGAPTSLQGLEHMLARIPSPPNAGHGASDENVTQSTMYVRQYYALLEKCQSWQRYAATMKERADNLEIENRFLRESSRKNEDEVRALERQLRGLKETAMLLDEERRRTESRIGSYNNEFDRQRQPSRQRFHHASIEPHRAALMALADVPSPPELIDQRNPTYSSGSSHTPGFSTMAISSVRPPSRSSNMRSEGDTPPSAALFDIDYINLQENGKHIQPLDATDLRTHALQKAVMSSQDYVPASMHQQRQESAHLAELDAQDAGRRETSGLQGAAYHPALVRGRVGMMESRSFPSCDVAPSAALTTQILAAHTREHSAAAAINRLPSSTSAPVLRAKAKNQSPAQQPGGGAKQTTSSYAPPQLRHQVSEGNGMAAHKATSHANVESATFGLGLQNANLEDHLGQVTMPSDSGRLSAVPGSRSASAQSDARTVTEDYLQGMVEQKRQLRKISLSQQQQMHFLQARIQINRSNSSLGVSNARGSANEQADVNDENIAPPFTAPLPCTSSGGLDSRPASRLSSNGNRRRPRSRAGSYSFHGVIPVDKDDVFSCRTAGLINENLSRRGGLKRSESAPLGQLTLNGRSGAVSALELRHYADEVVTQQDDQPEQRQQQLRDLGAELNQALDGADAMSTGQLVHTSNDTGDGSVSSSVSRSSSQENIGVRAGEGQQEDHDPKGAHRRLYVRLREELDPAELIRFERYVHRYDALQIEMEGAKGIINRVRRLLLPGEVVRAKHTHRPRYQMRKVLAREFERIVRDDAVPSEITSHSQQQQQAAGHQQAMLTSTRSPSHAFI